MGESLKHYTVSDCKHDENATSSRSVATTNTTLTLANQNEPANKPNLTVHDLQKVQELVNNPKSIFKENLSFFKDENTPNVFLQAFKLDEISVSKFAMLVNLYNSIQISEPIDCLSLYDEQSSKLVVNVANWEKINTTLTCFYNYNSIYVESTHIKCTSPIIDYADFIQKLQHQLASVSPLERFIFLFKKRHITTKKTTIHGKPVYIATKEHLENAMLRTPFPIFTTNKEDNFTIETNYTLINIAMKLVRGKDASTLNFVLGSSSADDIRKGFLNHSRDVGIQYHGNEFPILLHATVVERPSEATNHDVYHAIKQSYTHKKTIEFYKTMASKLQDVANNYIDAANELLSLYIKNPTEHCVNYKKLLILTYKIHAYLLNCVKELKKSNFTFCDCDLSIVDENKSTRRGVFCSRVYSMATSFKQHDIFLLRLMNTPFTIKQICKLFYSELKKEFNIPDKSAEEAEFIQELLVATWDVAITTQEVPRPLIKVNINMYNFIYCLSFYLMKSLSEYHRTENTNILLNSSMPDCQKDKNSIESSDTTDNYLHNNIDIMSVEDLQKYIDTGNELNAQNHQGDTVLHLLTQKNKADRKESHIEMIKLLVENGINLNIQNSSGKTALHCEIEGCNNTEIIKLLRNSGTDCNIKDNSNMLPYGLFLEKIKTGIWRNLIIKEVPICVRRPWVIEYTRLRTELAIP